ncbi:helix-turn-helix transcriptional regulator [Nocardia sp. NPDC058176]|uniref:helix-turn-helix transcriptional regulator n=1 Tax=Nocardia sp. NPDC058176 TaxID=3346368 RepID=UPI0036DA8150
MAVLIDSEYFAPTDRREAVTAILQEADLGANLQMWDAPAEVVSRHQSWMLGPIALTRSEVSGHQVCRTSRHERATPSDTLTVTVQNGQLRRHEQFGAQTLIEPGACEVIDLATTFASGWYGLGGTLCLQLSRQRLGISVETVAAAHGRLAASPLYPMVKAQIQHMVGIADQLETDPAAASLGESCLEMVRALLISAAGRGPGDGAAIPDQLLIEQILGYVRTHLADSALKIPDIAAANNISVRHLYKVCAQSGISLEQWIIEQRLVRARDMLIDRGYAHRSIASVAATVGFRDAAHFTRRFREAFGMTPRDWRRSAIDPENPPK